jgi:hypothetical protein
MVRPRPTTSRHRSRRIPALRALLLAVTTALVALVVATPAQAAAYCGITWGSLAKGASGADPMFDHVTGIRAGQHPCYDRLVIDLADAQGFNAYDVRYVTQVYREGSGTAVPLRGGAELQIVVHSNAIDRAGRVTFAQANPAEVVNVAGYRTFRQVASAGSFEGQTTLGLGVRARLPFRAFVTPGATAGTVRVVVDVAHLW